MVWTRYPHVTVASTFGSTVSLAWLSERLVMGHQTRVSQAVGQVKRKPDRRQKRWQKQLAKVGIGPEPSKD
jgi:hypothetical protein